MTLSLTTHSSSILVYKHSGLTLSSGLYFLLKGPCHLKLIINQYVYNFLLWICFLLQRSSWEPKQGTGIYFFLLCICILLWEIRVNFAFEMRYTLYSIIYFPMERNRVSHNLKEKKNHKYLRVCSWQMLYLWMEWSFKAISPRGWKASLWLSDCSRTSLPSLSPSPAHSSRVHFTEYSRLHPPSQERVGPEHGPENGSVFPMPLLS